MTTEHEALCARQDCGWAKNTARHDPCWLKVGFCGTPACHRFEPFKAVSPAPVEGDE